MEKPVISQLICAAVSLGGGIAFGVIYDLFKAFRLKLKNILFSIFADIIVCVLGMCILFLLFMSIGGGEARLYVVLCTALGAVIYFVAASRAMLGFFMEILSAIAKFLHFLVKPFVFVSRKMKKLYRFVKMYFQKSCKWFTIMVKGKVGKKAKKSLPEQDTRKELRHEAKAGKRSNKNRNPRTGDIRRSKSLGTKTANGQRKGKAR